MVIPLAIFRDFMFWNDIKKVTATILGICYLMPAR